MLFVLRRDIFGVEQICVDTSDVLPSFVDKLSGCRKAVIFESSRRRARLRAPAHVEQ